MVVLSVLRPAIFKSTSTLLNNAVIRRTMSDDHHRIFPMRPSRWQWDRFKDFIHFYFMLGVIPLTMVTCAANIFIGPATLQQIPEGYEPKHWEYHRHPVTRFIARYITNNPQQEYEKYLHHLFEENEIRLMRFLEERIKDKIAERQDYQAYYYRPVLAKYHRISREAADYVQTLVGGD